MPIMPFPSTCITLNCLQGQQFIIVTGYHFYLVNTRMRSKRDIKKGRF